MTQFELKNGQVFVLVEAAGGVYSADALALVCKVAETHSAFLKITEDQRIGFMIPEGSQRQVEGELQAQGLLLRPYQRSTAVSPKACLGELCPHAEQDALGDSLDLFAHLGQKDARNAATKRPFVSMGINGCYRACVGSAVDDVHIVGEESGYKISIGGWARELPQFGQFVTDNVPREKLAEVVGALLDVYSMHCEPEERVGDVIERIGLSSFSKAAERVFHGDVEETEPEAADVKLDDAEASESSEHIVIDGDDVSEMDGLEIDVSEMDITESDLLEEQEPGADFPLESGDLEAFEDIPLESLEEEGELADVALEGTDESIHVSGMPSVDQEGDARSDLEEDMSAQRADLLEEEQLDIQDASAEDLDRVTSALRAENAEGERDVQTEALPDAAGEADVDSEILAFERTRPTTLRAPEPRRHERNTPAMSPSGSFAPSTMSAAQSAPLSVRLEDGFVALSLPGGIALRCPVDSLEGESGALVELQTDRGLLTLSSEGGALVVRLGAMEILLPLASRRAA